MDELYELQRLLWDLRHSATMAAEFKSEPNQVMDRYRINEADKLALRLGDFETLIRKGANPLLVLFGAMAMGFSRSDYYSRVRSVSSTLSRQGE